MKFYCLMLFIFCGILATAQQKSLSSRKINVSLSGIITDAKTGEALMGASVFFQDEKIGTIAGADGKYNLRNVPAGHHLIEVSFTGYGSIVEHLDLVDDTKKDFTLMPAVRENTGVTITGVSNATSIRKAPIPVIAVRKADLLQTTSTNIIDALSRKAGISQVTTGPGISKPVIRGLGYNRVLIINEGVKQEGQQWGDEHGIEIDELSVNRVEILKGPASLMYGSDALAGVINFITNVPLPEGTIKGNIITNYQTNNNLVGLNGNIGGNKNGFNWNFYGSYKSARDYKNKFDGIVLHSRFSERNFGGYIGVNKSWGFSHVIFSSFNQKPGLIEGERDDATGKFILFGGTPLERIATDADLTSRELFIPNQNIQHYKITSDNSFAIHKSRVKLTIGFQNNLRKEFANPEAADEAELFFDLKTLSYNLQWVLPEIQDKEIRITIGLNGMNQNNDNKADEVLIPEYNLFDIGGFVYVQRSIKKVTLSGGLRYDNRSINSKELFEGTQQKFAGFTRSFSNFSGSAGLSYEATDFLTMKLNIARGFRAPNMAELASNGVHEGTNRYEYGQQNLKSEKSMQIDAGLDVDYPHFSFSFSAFYNNVNDFIYYRKLTSLFGGDSLVTVNGQDIPAFRFDQNNAGLYGIEGSFDLHPHPLDWLHFENTLSFVRGKFDQIIGGTNNLPMIPAPKLLTELRSDFKKVGKNIQNFYMKLETESVFAQDNPFTAFNSETKTAGYRLWNAGIGTEIFCKERVLFGIHFGALNITDKSYQNHLSRLKYTAENMTTGRMGVFNMGRNFSVKVLVPLNFAKQKMSDESNE